MDSKFRIGVNAIGLLPGFIGGGETYLRGVVAGLAALDSDHELMIFTNRDNHETFAGLNRSVKRVRFNVSAKWNLRGLVAARVVGEQLWLPWIACRYGLDVLHSPFDSVPLAARCAVVMTLHDMNFDAFPEANGVLATRLARSLVRVSARRADAIITVSEFSRHEVTGRLKIDPGRVFVVHNGGSLANHSLERGWLD